jgi:hypothetical protein
MKKIAFKLSLLLCVILTTHCQTKKMPPVDLRKVTVTIDISKADIIINDCGISYKGEKLPFGVSLSVLEKKYGKTRHTDWGNLIDDLGIGVRAWDPDVEKTTNVYFIFFTNMDSPEGKAGKLSFTLVNGRGGPLKPFDTIMQEYKNNNEPVSEELRAEILANNKKAFDPKQYFYPYTIYKGIVNLKGAAIKGDMNLQEINALRAQTKDLADFTFWDRNMNMVDETLTTEGKHGEYFQTTNTMCDGKLYRFVLFFNDYKLEYLSVEKLSNSDMQMIKDLTE